MVVPIEKAMKSLSAITEYGTAVAAPHKKANGRFGRLERTRWLILTSKEEGEKLLRARCPQFLDKHNSLNTLEREELEALRPLQSREELRMDSLARKKKEVRDLTRQLRKLEKSSLQPVLVRESDNAVRETAKAVRERRSDKEVEGRFRWHLELLRQLPNSSDTRRLWKASQLVAREVGASYPIIYPYFAPR
jgi:hypothetical protein